MPTDNNLQLQQISASAQAQTQTAGWPTDNSPLQQFAGITLQRSYMWDVVLPPIDDVNLPTQVALMCRSINMGNGITMEVRKTLTGAFSTHASGPLSTSQVTMTFLAQATGLNRDPVQAYFQSWFSKIVSARSIYHSKNKYAKESQAMLFDNRGAVISKVFMYNSFPVKIGKSALDFEGDKMVTWDIALSVDRLYFK